MDISPHKPYVPTKKTAKASFTGHLGGHLKCWVRKYDKLNVFISASIYFDLRILRLKKNRGLNTKAGTI